VTTTEAAGPRIIQVTANLLRKNAETAALNRKSFRRQGILAVNVLSSPGSGKTALLQATLARLDSDRKAAVIVGDLATDNDARRLHGAGAPVVQLTTGNLCHLESEMIQRACAELDMSGVRLLFIENVGNLVCPASYDLGEDLRVVLMSVTEGEDKPLKYPKMFKTAHVVLISKTDLATAVGFDRAAALENLRRIAPQAAILELSARGGEGMDQWLAFLNARLTAMHDLR
jgi:hydrogenase nickel incorporation protein HypB